jgi:hypothetical protein
VHACDNYAVKGNYGKKVQVLAVARRTLIVHKIPALTLQFCAQVIFNVVVLEIALLHSKIYF